MDYNEIFDQLPIPLCVFSDFNDNDRFNLIISAFNHAFRDLFRIKKTSEDKSLNDFIDIATDNFNNIRDWYIDKKAENQLFLSVFHSNKEIDLTFQRINNSSFMCMLDFCNEQKSSHENSLNLPGIHYKCSLGKNSHIVYLGKDIQDLCYYDTDEFLNKKTGRFHKIICKQDRRFILDEMNKAVTGKGYWDLEYRIICKDGSLKWVSDRAKIIKNDSFQPVFVEGIIFEISERKQIEEKYRLMFKSSTDVYFLMKEGVFIDCNQASEKALACSRAEIIGKSPLDFSPEYQPDGSLSESTAKEHIKKAYKEGFNSFEWQHKTADNKLFWVNINLTLMKTYNEKHLLVTWQDITDIKKAEKAIIDSKKQFECLISNVSDIIEVIDERGNILFVSDQLKDILGYSKEDLMSFSVFEYIHPEDLPNVLGLFTENILIPNIKLRTEYRYKHKDGHWIHLEATGTNLLYDPIIKGVVLSIRDISVRKNAELSLQKAKETAEAASKAKSEFLANMSHEIRTPLNAVIGFADLMMSTTMNKIQKEYAKNISSAGISLLGIINDILDFSKIEAGKLELEIIKTDIIELIENTADLVKLSASQKKIEFLLNISPFLPRYAYIDPIRLKQILVNLLNNAVKFTSQGEVELKVEWLDSMYHFSVKDTGIGINQEQQKKLFKAFSQADSSTTRKFGGTGLGLIISNLLAEKMNSGISLVSEPGKGSTFYFSLKCKTENGFTDSKKINFPVKRVMIIDDNANNRLILENNLSYHDIKFCSFDNGFTALEYLGKDCDFDVVIVDYKMPYLDGLQTVDMLRNKLGIDTEKLPVILLHSATEDKSFHDKCLEYGVRFNLNKPVKFSELYTYLMNVNDTYFQEIHFIDNESNTYKSLSSNEGMSVLIAEDVVINMLLIKTIITKMLKNANIYVAKNGLEAVRIFKKEDIDLVIMDINMPEMDGLEATQEIRKIDKGRDKKAVIFAVTAAVQENEKIKCFKAGMNEFIAKPVNAKVLKENILKYFPE